MATPVVDCAPDQASPAVHAVAPCEDQATAALCPAGTDAGDRVRLTGGLACTDSDWEAASPLPVQLSVYRYTPVLAGVTVTGPARLCEPLQVPPAVQAVAPRVDQVSVKF